VSTKTAVRAAVIAMVAALAAFVVAALAGGAVSEKVVPGVGDSGLLTRWGLPISQVALELTSMLTVGALMMAAFLLPAGKEGLGPDARRYVRGASWLAACWAVAAAATMVFTVSDILAEPVGTVLAGNELSSYVGQLPEGTALMLVVLMSVVVALLARTTVSHGGVVGLLVLAFIALLPEPVTTGHSAASPNHSVAITSMALHIAGIVPWVGGLALLAWFAMTGGEAALAVPAERFSRAALVCYVMVGASGFANVVVRLADPEQLFTSDYGRLVLVKVAAFAFLGWLGWTHRTRTLPAVAVRKPRAFIRLAAVEVAIMAGTVGVAVALSRTPPPAESTTEDPVKSLLGYSMPPPLTTGRLFTLWRFDLYFAVLVAVLGGLYVAGVLRLRRRGDRWPVGRTVAWMIGLLTIVVVTMSGVATYSPILFSVHMAQHMVLSMLTPIFLVLGAPITLALRALKPAEVRGDRGPREWLMIILHSRVIKVLTHPAVATVIFVASTYVLYFTPLFEAAMRAHLGHIAMLTHFLLAGGLFYWVLIGVDPAPHKLPYIARILVLFVTMPFHAFFGISLMNSSGLAESWYQSLGRSWGPSIVSDLHTGGSIAWAFGEIPTFIVLIAIVFQWFAEDQRLSQRLDRQADRAQSQGAGAGQETDELSDYNAYLARLARRGEKS